MANVLLALAIALLVAAIAAYAVLSIRTNAPPGPPLPGGWGPNVAIFDPTMGTSAIMKTISALFMRSTEFTSQRVALFFMPGTYNLSFKLGYYMTVYGLGRTPDLTVINGTIQVCNNNTDNDPVNCHTRAPDPGVSALDNFWRACENIKIVPPASVNKTNFWAVSQACAMRRVIIDGNIHFSEDNGYSSGGFIADSQISGGVQFGTQQQFLSRNVDYGDQNGVQGGAWNIVMAGCSGNNMARLPQSVTVVKQTVAEIAPKPYVFAEKDANGTNRWYIGVPNPRRNASGPPDYADITSISDFEIVISDSDLAAVAGRGVNIVVAPGIYNATSPIIVAPTTVVLGLGMPTLLAGVGGAIVAELAEPATGARVGGFLLEATSATDTFLLDWGRKASLSGSRRPGPSPPKSCPSKSCQSANQHSQPQSYGRHPPRGSADPSYLYDIYTRVGGAASPAAVPINIPAMVHINLENTICDNFWLWVADHGAGIPPSNTCGDWSAIWKNMHCPSCLIVDSDNVTFYGLATEHATGDDLVKWNGDNGVVYFFQSELPYHVPTGYNQVAFRGSGANLTLQGGGAYSFFPCDNVNLSTGFILRPDAHAKVFTRFLDGKGGFASTAQIGGSACGAAATAGSPGPAWCSH